MGYNRNIHHTFADSPYPTKTHTNVERTKKGSKARIRKPNQIYKPYRQYAYSLYERESD